jgi:hypothetical protein
MFRLFLMHELHEFWFRKWPMSSKSYGENNHIVMTSTPGVNSFSEKPGGGGGRQPRGRQLGERHHRRNRPCTCRSHCRQPERRRPRHTCWCWRVSVWRAVWPDENSVSDEGQWASEVARATGPPFKGLPQVRANPAAARHGIAAADCTPPESDLALA